MSLSPSAISMRHPFAALIWEMWRSQRCACVSVLAAIPICAVFYRLLPMRESELLRGVSFLPMAGSLFCLFIVFRRTESDPWNRSSGFPSRLFTLPVRTWVLVTCPMACGVAATTIVYFCWAKFVFEPIGHSMPLGWPCLYLAASMLCFQSIVWTLARFRMIRLIALGVCGTVIATGWLLFQRDISEGAITLLPAAWARWPMPGRLLISLVLLSCGACFSSFFAVRNQRHLGRKHPFLFRKVIDAAENLWPRSRAPFSSPASAQSWLEWRRHGVLLPLVVAALLVLIMISTVAFGQLDVNGTVLTLSWMLAAPLAVAAAIGKGFGKLDLWSNDLAVPSFLAVRPMRSDEWIAAKLKVAALSTVASWSLVVGLVPVWFVYRGDFRVLVGLWNSLEVIGGQSMPGLLIALAVPVGAVLTWRMLVAGICIGMWGQRAAFLGSTCLGFALVFLALQACLWFQSARPPLHHFVRFSLWLPWVLNALFIVKISVAAWAWHSAIRRGAVTPCTASWYFGCWFAGTGLLLLFIVLLVQDVAWIRRLMIFLALLALPLARIGLATLALDRNRSR